jgi:hypothetical protein
MRAWAAVYNSATGSCFTAAARFENLLSSEGLSLTSLVRVES